MGLFGKRDHPELTKEVVLERLRALEGEGLAADLVALGVVGDVRIDGGSVTVTLQVSNPDESVRRKIGDAVKASLRRLESVESVGVIMMTPAPKGAAAAPPRPPAPPGRPPVPASQGANPFDQQAPIPGIDRIIAVGSGKGGVGKSSVALNLACSLSLDGLRVGLLDADIYGPSIAIMAGHRERPLVDSTKNIAPARKFGLSLMSMGFLVSADEAVVWRGPMLMGALQQFLRQVNWGELDALVVDLPPGTGDVPLTLAQTVPLFGAVIVTTPQEVALADSHRSIRAFEKVKVPILGLVENMSGFTCDGCGETYDIFGSGGAESESQALGLPVLGRIPLDPSIRHQADAGEPLVVARPDVPTSIAFRSLAEAVWASEPHWPEAN